MLRKLKAILIQVLVDKLTIAHEEMTPANLRGEMIDKMNRASEDQMMIMNPKSLPLGPLREYPIVYTSLPIRYELPKPTAHQL